MLCGGYFLLAALMQRGLHFAGGPREHPTVPPTLSQLRRAVDALPGDERLAVLLVCVEGLSYRDAARTLEVPLEVLSARLLRGRLTLIGAVRQSLYRDAAGDNRL